MGHQPSSKNPDDLLKASPALSLSAINEAVFQPRRQADTSTSAKQILAELSARKMPRSIDLDDVSDAAEESFEDLPASTAMLVSFLPMPHPMTPPKPSCRADIIACFGAETDRSGKARHHSVPKRIYSLQAEALTYSDWWKQAEGRSKHSAARRSHRCRVRRRLVRPVALNEGHGDGRFHPLPFCSLRTARAQCLEPPGS